MEESYQIRSNAFNDVRKKILLRVIPMTVIAVAAGFVISPGTNDALVYLIPFFLIVVGVGIFRGMYRQKKALESYKLIVDETKVTRKQNLTSDIEIPLNDITEIVKSKNGGLAIKGPGGSNSFIYVPTQLENIEQLEYRLSQIKEISEVDKRSIFQQFPWALPLLVIGLLIAVYISENKYVVGIAGVGLSIGLTYALILIQKSKHIDRKTKRGSWLILLVLFSVVSITYAKLLAGN